MNISNEELKEIGQILIAVSEGKPLEYRMGGSGNPWEDYKETDIDLEYELHLYRQGKRFRVKDPMLVRMQKVEEERQKNEEENRKLKQLLLMGVPIQYHQFHNWQPVKDFEHFIELEKEVYSDFRINPAFNRSQVYFSDKSKELHFNPKHDDIYVGSGERYINWIKTHLKWQVSKKSDKTYYIQPFDGTSAESWEECENHLFTLSLWQDEHIAKL